MTIISTAIPELKNTFLIAMPALKEPQFFHSVIYICEHNAQGAIGIIINQPLQMPLAEIFHQLGIKAENVSIAQKPVFSGGPIHRERGFIFHPTGSHWESTVEISSEISLTTSPDILRAIAENTDKAPKDYLVALGYSYWKAWQLENELSTNSWLYGPASAEVLFRQPVEKRWRAAAALLGVDTDKISDDIGHA
jgi:putative transcriptional regulator